MSKPDVTNRFLAIEIWLPSLTLLVAGVSSFASLSNEVEHKASAEDVAVLTAKVSRVESDVEKIIDRISEQRDLLESIARAVDASDNGSEQ